MLYSGDHTHKTYESPSLKEGEIGPNVHLLRMTLLTDAGEIVHHFTGK